jgi:hypothetical protein
MCFPIAALGLKTASATMAAVSTAATVASTAMSIVGQKQQADAQYKAQEAAMRREQQSHLQSLTAARVKQSMENEVLTNNLIKNTKNAAAARATAMTSAIENNKGGTSVNAMLADYTRQEGETAFQLVRQAQFGDISRDFGFEKMETEHANKIAQLNPPIKQPNYLAEGLDMTTSLAGTYSTYQTNRLNELKIGQMS